MTFKLTFKDIKGAAEAQLPSVLKDIVKELKAATPVDTGEARDGWRVEGNTIVNDVDHIGDLNDGTSQQAPAHFVEAVLLAHPGVYPNGTIVRSR